MHTDAAGHQVGIARNSPTHQNQSKPIGFWYEVDFLIVHGMEHSRTEWVKTYVPMFWNEHPAIPST